MDAMRPAAGHTAYAIQGAGATHSEFMFCRKPDMSQIWTAKQKKAPSMQDHLQKLSLSTPSSVALLLDRLVI